jgi:hypothetical protein
LGQVQLKHDLAGRRAESPDHFPRFLRKYVSSDAPFLTKPLDANELIALLRRISERSNAA